MKSLFTILAIAAFSLVTVTAAQAGDKKEGKKSSCGDKCCGTGGGDAAPTE